MSSIRATLLGLTLLAPAAFAQDESLPWLLALSALRDENAYEHVVASFHYGFSEATWLSATAGTSHAPAFEADVRADLLDVAIEHDFGRVGIAFGLQSWGGSRQLETDSLRSEVFFSGERYRFALNVEQRDIDIYFDGSGAPQRIDLSKRTIDADGLGVRARFRPAPDWQIYGQWMEYDYPDRLGVVPRADRLNLLSTSTVTLAYSFVDWLASIGIERSFGQVLLNVDLGQNRSAIDQSKLSSLSAAVLFPVATRFDLEVSIGSSHVDGSASTLYGGVTLFYYGGG